MWERHRRLHGAARGSGDCSVRVDTDDGHTMEWRRRRDEVSYSLDGREVNRLNGSPPDDLHDLLRLPLVESRGTKFDVHFGEQKQPIFLLDRSIRSPRHVLRLVVRRGQTH